MSFRGLGSSLTTGKLVILFFIHQTFSVNHLPKLGQTEKTSFTLNIRWVHKGIIIGCDDGAKCGLVTVHVPELSALF